MLGQNEDFFDSLDEDTQLAFLEDGEADDLFSEGSSQRTRFARVKRFRAPTTVKYEHALAAAKEIGHLEEGDHVDMIVSGDFIAGDFIEAYLEQNQLIASEIILSTLSLSSENVDSLANVKNHYCAGRMGLIVSDYWFANELRDGVEDLIANLAGDDFSLAVAGIHTKITLIRTECGQSLVLGGSANLRSSLNIEQITIDNNATLYAFHREWMAKILNQYHVQHKMLRRKPLWQLVAKAAAPAKPDADSVPPSGRMPKNAPPPSTAP